MSTVISVENLGKKYIIGHQQQEPYLTLRDSIAEKFKETGRRLLHPFVSSSGQPLTGLANTEEFWALKDVSFDVQQGDRVGIIGRNGSGKTTLLKVLSRITEPTTGCFTIKGRVASLLEVGTGFHPELTGRENIFLNGAILGMIRADIQKKFDEIVAFADVEKFLDTPVKRYSSGMYVRLAFAVAAHLEPEILIVDEVLAVGDAAFQKKCLGKMDEASKQGRTVIFVSHNMNAIEQLCTSAILLERGSVREWSSNVLAVIRDYLFDNRSRQNSSKWVNAGEELEHPWFKPLRFLITDENGQELEMPVSNDSEMWVQVEAEIREVHPALTVGYAIYSDNGLSLYRSSNTDGPEREWHRPYKGRCTLRSRIPKRFLNEGSYRIELIGSLHFREWILQPGVSAPSIYLTINGGLSDSPYWTVRRPGMLAPVFEWEVWPERRNS